MTDYRQSSPINLFKPSVASASQEASSYGGRQSIDFNGVSFSRELSRASEPSTPSRTKLSHQKKDGPESTASSSQKSRSDRPDRDSVNSPDSNTRTSTTRGSDSRVSKASEQSHTKAPKQDELSSTKTTPLAETKGTDNNENSLGQGGADLSVSATEQKEKQTGSDAGLIADASESTINAESTTISDAESMVESETEGLSVSDQASSILEGAPAEMDNHPQPFAVEGAAKLIDGSAVSPDEQKNNVTDRRVNQGSAPVLLTNQQITPAQLAVQQAQLASKAAARGSSPAALVGRLVGSSPSDIDPDSQLTRLSDNSTTLAQLVNANSKALGNGANSEHPGNNGKTGNPALLKQQPEVDMQSRRLQEAELKLQADMDTKVTAQKVEQQMNQANLLQARQLEMQQTQNLAPVSQAALLEAGGSSIQSRDNMFHSGPGGIVTAPVQQRADAGSTLSINAPFNMSILEKDADKEMASNIRWMVNGGVKSAVVNVTPSGMGPISVSIGLEKEQMNVSIVALQGSTREALDSMIPRLREQLAAQGHDSVKVDISDGRAEQSGRGYEGAHPEGRKGFEQGGEEGTGNGGSNAGAEKTAQNGNSEGLSQGTSQLINGMRIRSSYDIYV